MSKVHCGIRDGYMHMKETNETSSQAHCHRISEKLATRAKSKSMMSHLPRSTRSLIYGVEKKQQASSKHSRAIQAKGALVRLAICFIEREREGGRGSSCTGCAFSRSALRKELSLLGVQGRSEVGLGRRSSRTKAHQY